MIGFFFVSLYDAIFSTVGWPAIALVVDESLAGSAYGLVMSLANVMISIIPLLTGMIHDSTMDIDNGYFWTCIQLAGVGLIAFSFTLFLYLQDKRTGNRL